jgi:predicted pyridoxine 5'-phosphate oxidase superfamily flavin-nucleotide-binding protein
MARTFRTSLPAPLMRFLATQRWIIVGATDTAGRVWASPVVGAPGFVRAADETTVRIDALPVTSDPLRNLADRPAGQPAGLLAIDLGRRNRARINGTLRHDACGVVMSDERAHPNCMKYIQRREGAASGGIFFFDPDGIRLEIFTPTGADVAPAPSGTAPTCGSF